MQIEEERPISDILLLREEELFQQGDEALSTQMSAVTDEDPPLVPYYSPCIDMDTETLYW